jgi:Nucleotidyl transferase AbiEii toxin, Type IV TA system
MLHFETVNPGTLSLLNHLFRIKELSGFSLLVGTALSLKFGHRTSVDIDLFSNNPFDKSSLISVLEREFGAGFEFNGNLKSFGIFCFINNVKVDLIHYPHQTLQNPAVYSGGLRLYSDMDIAAMKINAILGRGKKKDFWDLAELFNKYSLAEIIMWHKRKYPNQLILISIPQALLYFADAEDSEEPVSMKGQTWASVKKSITETVNDF